MNEYIFIWKQTTNDIGIHRQIIPKVFGIETIPYNFGMTIIASIQLPNGFEII